MDSPPHPHSAPPNMDDGPPPGFPQSISNAASPPVLSPSPTRMIPPSAPFPFNSMIAPATLPTYDGGSHSGSSNVDSGKKKRGRPRKYAANVDNVLRLAPTATVAQGESSAAPDSEKPPAAKKPRGRPPGSGKKQITTFGSGRFTLHVLSANPGEDVAAKVVTFLQQGPRSVVIISANGTIQSAALRYPGRSSGSTTVTYEEGPYDLISMSGSFLRSENNGIQSITGGLSTVLSAPDRTVLGGGVAGILMAGSQVQVIIGSFLEDDKKSDPSIVNPGSTSAPPQRKNLRIGAAAVAASSSPSSGESSEEIGGSSRQHRMWSNSNSQGMYYMQQQEEEMQHQMMQQQLILQQQMQMQMQMYRNIWAPR